MSEWKLPEGTQLVLVDNSFKIRVDTGSSCRDCFAFNKDEDYQDTGDGDCMYDAIAEVERDRFEKGCLAFGENGFTQIFKLEPIT